MSSDHKIVVNPHRFEVGKFPLNGRDDGASENHHDEEHHDEGRRVEAQQGNGQFEHFKGERSRAEEGDLIEGELNKETASLSASRESAPGPREETARLSGWEGVRACDTVRVEVGGRNFSITHSITICIRVQLISTIVLFSDIGNTIAIIVQIFTQAG